MRRGRQHRKSRPQLPKLHDEQRKLAREFKQHRFVVLRCGRRFGKTTLLERCAAKAALQGYQVGWFGPQYRLNLPTYKRTLRMVQPVVEHKSKVEQILELNTGGSIEFWTLNDEDAGRSRFYDLAILDEASLVKRGLRDIWEQSIAPTLLDKGGSAIMAGTPKGIDVDNFFYESCTNPDLGWVEFHRQTVDNPLLDKASLDRLPEDNPPLVYQQEYLAEFVDWNGASFFPLDSLLVDSEPVDVDWRVDQVFAVVDTASKTDPQHDGTAVIMFGRSSFSGYPLVVLDWDVVQIEASLLIDWLPNVHNRLEELANELRARQGNLGIWIEDKDSGVVLLQSAPRHGIPVEPIDTTLTSQGKDQRAIAASPYTHQGLVKLSRHAFDKTTRYRQQNRNHLITQVCGFRVGEKLEHNMDLLDCFTYGVVIALGNSRGF